MNIRVLPFVLFVTLFPACSGDKSNSVVDSTGEDTALDVRGPDSKGDTRTDLNDDATTPNDLVTDEKGDTTGIPGGAVAFVATSQDQLIPGPVSAGIVGDVVIQNEVVRFVIRNQKHSLYSPYGGALVDADLVRADGEAAADTFFEMFPMTGLARIFYPSDMTIVDDGAKSGTAIVRFKGTDGGMSLVDSAFPTSPLGVEVTVEYILAQSPMKVDVGQFLQFSSRTTAFYDDCGNDQDCLLSDSSASWLASADGKVSYGVTLPKGKTIKLMLAFDKLTILSGGTYSIPTGGEVVSRQFFIVGEGTIEDIRAKAKAIREEEQGKEVQVQVSLSDQWSEMNKALIRVRKSSGEGTKGWVTATTPNSEGQAVLHLEPGTYEFHLTLPGAQETVLPSVEITSDGTNLVPLTANAAGWLRVSVTDEANAPIPAALTLQSGADAPWTTGVTQYVAIQNGEATFPILAGDYTATVARGLVWSIERKNVKVVAGQVVDLSAKIHEAVDTTGFVMMNSHEHTENSIDSSVWVQDRIANALANGIELMTPTDHDFFGTRQPTIQEMGVEGQIKSSLGCEVSPLWGHTTAAHCATPPTYPTYFAVQYMQYDENGKVVRPTTATEIYTQAREEFGCFFLAVNHPYRGGATFETYGVTATSNPADAEPKLNLHLVDALEVYNKDDNLNSILTENLPAWFNLLNRGYSIAAIGGSDEHHYRGNYGNPRNMVMSSTDLPGEIDLDEVYQNVKDHGSVVLGGPVIRLTVDGKGLGETVTAAGTSVEVHVVVEAPEWMGLEFVRVFVNGEMVKEFTPVETGVVLRLDETTNLDLVSDAWIVVLAGSSLAEHEMVPVSGKQPFSVTNPVFVDFDANGYQAIYAAGAPWDKN